jgi:cytochrome c-type biogenesis protein
MLNVLKVPFLSKEIQIKTPTLFQKGNPINSFILGTTFGLGWTPCIGPVLGSLLTLATAATTAVQGAFLLGVFSFGLAIPFLVIAVGFGSAVMQIAKLGKILNVIAVIGGLFLIFLGLLLLTNKLGLWVAYFYQFFDFINYDRLLDYL